MRKDAEVAASPAAGDDEPGADPRRLAERKADAAGHKARAALLAAGQGLNETGGPQGLEPTRYGDWERAGRCVDF